MSQDSLLFYSRRGARFGQLTRTLHRHFNVFLITTPDGIDDFRNRTIAAALVDSGGKDAAAGEVIARLRDLPNGGDIVIGLVRDTDTEVDGPDPGDARADTEFSGDLPVATMLSAFWSAYERRDSLAWNALDRDSRKALVTAKEAFDVMANLPSDPSDPAFARALFSTAATRLTQVANTPRTSLMLEQLRGHHNYTFSHSTKVAVLLSGFGAEIGLGPGEQRILAEAGLLHDTGKLQIPTEVLGKPAGLTDDEFEIMKTHASLGGDTLQELYPDMPEIAAAARHHHEKLDGSGYPDGLKGIEISEVALLAAVVDIFSALTDKRDYKEPMSAAKAFEIMRPLAGSHIDGRLLSEFESYVQDSWIVREAAAQRPLTPPDRTSPPRF
ncbi:MAG: HD domain-containing protein [Alphaproteobacteria bacterium]|nr:HD domain-containing protein [Alphaproteobacteria bacterium]